jgi:sterol 3beta-glucosyltransferase
MQLTILTVGSRGDVQPYLALGRGLQAAGHQVRLATHPPFEREIRSHGLAFAPITGNPRELLHSPEGLAWLEAGRNPLRGTRRLLALARPHLTRMLADAVSAGHDAEAIIYAPLGLAGAHIAEATGVPAVLASLVPLTPTRSFPAAGAPTWPLGGAYNHLTHLAAEQLSWQPFRRLINQWRRQSLGLGPAPLRGLVADQRRRQAPVLYGYSPSVLSKPPDWGAHLHVTGYWFGDPQPDWQPPAALAGFLAGGPPPSISASAA